MRVRSRVLGLWLLVLTSALAAQAPALPPPTPVADGIQRYELNDPGLLNPPGPVAVHALRLDPRKVSLEIGIAQGEPSRETVEVIAERRPAAVAAINAGFFSLETGRPQAFLKQSGTVVSGTARSRGAVGITTRG